MKFETTRFGSIEINSDEVFIMPEGPLGFPDCTRFVFIEEDGTHPFRMMQSLDKPSLAFVVVDPLMVKNDYTFSVTKNDLKQIKADDVEALHVLAIVTMAQEFKNITVNLQGPIVINTQARLMNQFVLVNSPYTTKEKLLADGQDAESLINENRSNKSLITKKAM